MDIGPKLTLKPEYSGYLYGHPVRVGTYRSQTINGVLAQVHLTVGPMADPISGYVPGP